MFRRYLLFVFSLPAVFVLNFTRLTRQLYKSSFISVLKKILFLRNCQRFNFSMFESQRSLEKVQVKWRLQAQKYSQVTTQ